ncbi:MAG: hypothetical protein JKY37_31965 [Nannocystaceae bacterium]|nr:hypothetical protein [Nannocystaceae bacterium]
MVCCRVALGLLVGTACAQPNMDAELAAAPHRESCAVHGVAHEATQASARHTAAPVELEAAASPAAQSAVLEGTRRVASDVASGLSEFVGTWSGGGALWAGCLAGNGGRDVLIFIPPGLSPQARVQLVFHFHGTYSETIAAHSPGMAKKQWVGHKRLTQTMEALSELQQRRDGNVVLIYPLSAGKRPEPGWQGWFNKAYDRMWMSPLPEAGFTDDFNRLHGEVLAVITDELGVASDLVDAGVVAEGHSAGGIALRNLAEAGTSLVAEYLFLDASFQSWSDRCWAAVQRDADGALVTIVQTTGGIADPHQGRDPWCVTMPAEAAAWPEARAYCETVKRPRKSKPRGRSETCATLKIAAEQWPRYKQWCDALAGGFSDIARLRLVRTDVSHGEQPREFSGGLNLPVAGD